MVIYHVANPPHPKFLLVPKRWLSIRLHLLTGITEIFASTAGIYIANVNGRSIDVLAIWAARAGIIHALTAFYQTQLVFGAKIIMHPAYYAVSYMHLFSACVTLRAPTEPHLLAQYLVLCIFTWCRVYMALFRSLNFAMGALYSLSITLAGVTTGALVLGPLSVLEIVIFLALAASLWCWSANCSVYSVAYEELTREHKRTELLDVSAMNAWKGIANGANDEESEAAARKAFDRLDVNRDGVLDANEVVRLLDSLNIHPTVRHAVSNRLAAVGGIDFSTFVRSIWNLGTKNPGANLTMAQLEAMTTPEEQARAVFDSIDLDGSHELEPFEICELLIQWGCPEDEVTEYIRRVDIDHSGTISFQEFFTKMHALWSFGYNEVLKERAADKQHKGWNIYDAATPRASAARSPRTQSLRPEKKES